MSNSDKKNKNTVLIVIMTVFCLSGVIIILGGCSPQERSGVSRLPHNRPASWEHRTFAQ